MKLDAYVRLAVLIVLLGNQTLLLFGYDPLPFDENQIYEGLSTVALVLASLWTYWKNNSITDEAVKADIYLQELKKEREKNE